MRSVLRYALVAAGFVCVILGVAGTLFPLLPTTPFLLLAAFFFARSSARFHSWLLTNRWSGPYLRAWRSGRPMPPQQLAGTLVMLWISIAVSAWLVPLLAARVALVVIAGCVSVYLIDRNRRLAESTKRGAERS